MWCEHEPVLARLRTGISRVLNLLQMVSLLHLANITEEGVQFASPVDGSLMMLTPEHSMAIQNKLGAPYPLKLSLLDLVAISLAVSWHALNLGKGGALTYQFY